MFLEARMVFLLLLPALAGALNNIERLNCPRHRCLGTMPFMCMEGRPHTSPADMPANFTVAMIADQGLHFHIGTSHTTTPPNDDHRVQA